MRRLGSFELEKVVREDAYGVVYSGGNLERNWGVAVRWIKPELVQDAEVRRSFLRDARLAGTIRNERIAVVHEVGEHEGHVYQATEWLNGESLEARLSRGPVSLDFALWVIREAALGLHAAHRAGLVHGAIQPASLWLEAGSQRGKSIGWRGFRRPNLARQAADTSWRRVKVLDFGMAHLERGQQNSDSGQAPERVAYLAPEQIAGAPADSRTDIYALGVLLYRMLAGRLPFEGTSAREVRAAIGKRGPRPIAGADIAVPQPVHDLIHRMLRANPGGRPARAEEVAHQIDAIRNHVIAPTVRSPRSRSRRWLLTRIVAVIMAVTVGVAAWAWFSRSEMAVEVPVIHPVESTVSVLTPQQAIQAIGERVTVEFTVAAIQWGSDQVYLLPDRNPGRAKDPAFRVAISMHLIDGMRRRGHFWPDELQGATIRLHGVVEKDGGYGQILVGDLEQFDAIAGTDDRMPRKAPPSGKAQRAGTESPGRPTAPRVRRAPKAAGT